MPKGTRRAFGLRVGALQGFSVDQGQVLHQPIGIMGRASAVLVTPGTAINAAEAINTAISFLIVTSSPNVERSPLHSTATSRREPCGRQQSLWSQPCLTTKDLNGPAHYWTRFVGTSMTPCLSMVQ